METFRKDGVYILSRYSINGGKFKSVINEYNNLKYSFFQKFIDIISKGKTRVMVYDIIFFYKFYDNETQLYMCRISGELDGIFETFKNFNNHYFAYGTFQTNFELVAQNRIKYFDEINQECFLEVRRNGCILYENCYNNDVENGKESLLQVYEFYPLLITYLHSDLTEPLYIFDK